MNIDEIRKIQLVEFLNQLGYQPTGSDSKGLWFYAPYRSERKPSFHVNPRKNVWFDFGSGTGGDIFTLAGELCNLKYSPLADRVGRDFVYSFFSLHSA